MGSVNHKVCIFGWHSSTCVTVSGRMGQFDSKSRPRMETLASSCPSAESIWACQGIERERLLSLLRDEELIEYGGVARSIARNSSYRPHPWDDQKSRELPKAR